MIKQAIIPLAGLGTRLLPLTSVFPKELLPINGKPGIEYILDECIEAGVSEIIFIISKKKEMIKKYFNNDNFYKSIIKKKKDPRIIKEYKKILFFRKKIKFVYQNKPMGTGDAVLKTKRFIKNNYFLILLPDDLIMKKNCSKDMIKIHKKLKGSVMASMKVKKNNVDRWGIYSIKKKIDQLNFKIAASSPILLTRCFELGSDNFLNEDSKITFPTFEPQPPQSIFWLLLRAFSISLVTISLSFLKFFINFLSIKLFNAQTHFAEKATPFLRKIADPSS